jgi:hypothetical protein
MIVSEPASSATLVEKEWPLPFRGERRRIGREGDQSHAVACVVLAGFGAGHAGAGGLVVGV